MRSWVRLALSFVVALVFTGGVFSFLGTLIRSKIAAPERQEAARIEFSQVRRDTETKTIKRQKPEPVKPMQVSASAPKIDTGSVAGIKPSAGPIAIGYGAGAMVDVRGVLGGPMAVSVGGSDRDEMPLVRVEPVYPERALSRGVEGWALVEFTITSAGTTTDVRAVESQPPGVFDAAAVKAVQSWKYNPKVEGGTAIDRRGMRVLLSFKVS